MHFLLASLLGIGVSAIGQEAPPTFYRQYATQQYMKKLMADHPEMREVRSAIERQTYDFQRYGLPDSLTIAVVFHVVGTPAAAITMADVQEQVDALNRDFSDPVFPGQAEAHQAWHAERFSERAAKPNIRFCLANQGPGGGPAGGVLYVPSQVPSWAVGAGVMNAQQGGSTGWDPQHYLNVYITQLDNGVSGFAQMPGGPAASDGIAINVDYFIRKNQNGPNAAPASLASYRAGRTLSHLVGSYLNLYELWNDDQPCADDNVMDTPIHNAPNYEKPGYRHVSTCMDNPVEMTMNIMDNTDDEAQYMFTNGQMMRMYATLAVDGGARAGLRTPGAQCNLGNASNGEATDNRTNEDGNNATAKNLPLTIQAYPNPASDGFTVMVTAPCDELIVLQAFNQLGTQQHRQVLENVQVGMTNTVYINTRDWQAGMYVLHAQCGNETASVKILLEH